MIYVIILLLILSLFLNLALWRRYRRNAHKVSFLFNAIDNGDFSFRFPETKSKDDELVNASLNRIKTILQHARNEQIEREKYYEVILDSVDTGILVVDEQRGIVLRSNKAARTMLKRQTITHISQVSDRLTAFSSRESHTTLQGKKVKILAFSDIHGELANQEIDAWVKLIRVLTHEIMNTITPVIALSDTTTIPTTKTSSTTKTTDSEPSTTSEEQKKLRIIHSTSVELMEFVENYRKFTHVPTPHPTLFYVKPFVARLANLAEHWLKPGCTIHVNIEPEDLMVYADEGLTSRVVSNLIKNAAEAIGNDDSIMIHAYTGEHDNVTIDISDDGPAIPAELAAHIFVPFFTTKKQGSGIGLSISRQIMRTMGGMIELVSNTEPTTFRLTFQ